MLEKRIPNFAEPSLLIDDTNGAEHIEGWTIHDQEALAESFAIARQALRRKGLSSAAIEVLTELDKSETY